MKDTWILTLMGEEQAKIIEALSSVIAKHQGNWLESRIATMSHKFVAIISLEIPQNHSSNLQDELEKFSDLFELVMLVSVNGQTETPDQPTATVKVTANDRPGIVLEVSKALVDSGLTANELLTHRESAPFGNENLFTAIINLHLSEQQAETLTLALEKLGDDFIVDVEFS